MSFGPGYACADCGVLMRPRKNSVFVLVTMDDGRPYQIWNGDLWECPRCGHQGIYGWGANPISEHYEDNFKQWLSEVDFTISGKLEGLPDET